MKKIMIMLAMFGFPFSGAEAQTTSDKCTFKKKVKKVAKVTRKPVRTAAVSKTYQVCKEEGGYYSCCLYQGTSTAKAW